MSAFTIFLIVVTIGYVLYYAAIITIDLNAKPKGDGMNEESVDTADLVSDVQDQPSDDDELYDEHDSDGQDESQDDYHEDNIDNDEVDKPEDNDIFETYQHNDEPSDYNDDEDRFHDDEERTDETNMPGEEEYEEEPSQAESPGYPADIDAVSETFENSDEPERSDVHSLVLDTTEDETITVIDKKDSTADYEESDDFDDDTELTPEQRAALIAEFQSSMDKDESINLVEPIVHDDDDIFEDPDEDKYEVKEIVGPDDADEGDIPRAINAALEQTMPESTTPMDVGLLSEAAMGRLGVNLDGTSHYERT